MWKPNRTSKCNWCVPRKVVNIYSEKDSSFEKIVTSKKSKKTKPTFRTKRNMKVKKDETCLQQFARAEIITNPSQKMKNPTAFGKVKKRALRAIASKRVNELAVPKNAAILNTNVKKLRDPFKVKPSALKAFCSQRTKILARPKNLENSADKLRTPINRQLIL